MKQPLVPIGCAATVYFLASGLKSFQQRDPVRSQRMMKYRVMAQFVTLACFAGYVVLDRGWEQLDFRVAPMYQDAKKGQASVPGNEQGQRDKEERDFS
jgi:Hypoxia induced protein conserved region